MKKWILLVCLGFISITQAQITASFKEITDSVFAISGLKNINVSILLPDSSVWNYTRGINSNTPGDSMVPSLKFGIGSVTKTYTATLVLLMQESGKLSIDDTVGKYFRGLPNIPGSITLKQLLNHTSGLYDYLNDTTSTIIDSLLLDPMRIWQPEEIILQFVGAQKFKAGTQWMYSNTNFLLLQMILEKLENRPYHVILKERILMPFKLNQTLFYPSELPEPGTFADAWADFDGNGSSENLSEIGFPLQGFFSLAAGSGAIIATAEDNARFMYLLQTGKILQPNTLLQMQDFSTVQNLPGGIQYGLGTFGWENDCRDLLGHDGSILYKTFCLASPETGLGGTVATNDDADQLGTVYNLLDLLTNTFCRENPLQTDPIRKMDWAIFPNPASEFIYLQGGSLSPQADIGLYTLEGKNILRQTGLKPIPISNLTNGTYLLRVSGSEGQIQQKKFMVMRNR